MLIKYEKGTKNYYISLISKMCDHYGNYLVVLMNRHKVNNLQKITVDQAKEFYYWLVKELHNG